MGSLLWDLGEEAAAASRAVSGRLRVVLWVSANIPVTPCGTGLDGLLCQLAKRRHRALVWDPVPLCCGRGVAVSGLCAGAAGLASCCLQPPFVHLSSPGEKKA